MELVEVELKPLEMHWLEEGDPHDDCCIHGRIFLKLGDKIVSDGVSEWTVSTAAFRLLKTITAPHIPTIDEALIPCCGFNMWPVESAEDGLYIPNCNNGIEWGVQHTEPNIVAHTFRATETYYTDLRVWSRAVCDFSDRVHEFFQTAWPKNFYDDEERKGFEMFMTLWKNRREAADLMDASRKRS